MHATITLTTDFGARGPFVGVMKAVILRHAPGATIVDLTHDVAPCWCAEAGFWLARTYRYLPEGTVHVAVVDPGVGTTRRIIAVAHDGHVFLAPDNGILTMVPGLAVSNRIHRLSDDWRRRQGWPEPSHTFHGRDIFAPLAAGLASGRVRVEDIGPAIADPGLAALPEPEVDANTIRGQVVAIDTWGNLITNIDRQLLQGISRPVVEVGAHRVPVQRTYGEVAHGALHALINSFDVLEIACNQGNAAKISGAAHGDVVLVSGL